MREVKDAHIDTDGSRTALHHTLGAGHNQAAPGDHMHDGGSSQTLTTLLEGITLTGTRPYNSSAVESVVSALVAYGATDNTTKEVAPTAPKRIWAGVTSASTTDALGNITFTINQGWIPAVVIATFRAGATGTMYLVNVVNGSTNNTTNFQARVLTLVAGAAPAVPAQGVLVGIYVYMVEA